MVTKGKKGAEISSTIGLHPLFSYGLISTQFGGMCWEQNNILGLFRIHPFVQKIL